jgi:membrane-associated protein
MQAIQDLLQRLTNLPDLVQWAGIFGLAAIVFSETGLLVGFFLPGDSLLVTAGLFAARNYLDIYWLVPALTIAAICGNTLGYFIGRVTGPRIFNRENSLFFNKKHAIRASRFYAEYGRKTIVLAQFMPILRTFSPVIAGVAGMRFREFFTFNVIGAFAWIWSMLGTGYFLGTYVPNIEKNIEIVIAVVIFVSILPAIISGLKARHSKHLAEIGVIGTQEAEVMSVVPPGGFANDRP